MNSILSQKKSRKKDRFFVNIWLILKFVHLCSKKYRNVLKYLLAGTITIHLQIEKRHLSSSHVLIIINGSMVIELSVRYLKMQFQTKTDNWEETCSINIWLVFYALVELWYHTGCWEKHFNILGADSGTHVSRNEWFWRYVRFSVFKIINWELAQLKTNTGARLIFIC